MNKWTQCTNNNENSTRVLNDLKDTTRKSDESGNLNTQ